MLTSPHMTALDVTEAPLNSHGGHTELGTSAAKEAFSTTSAKRHPQHLPGQLYSTSPAW